MERDKIGERTGKGVRTFEKTKQWKVFKLMKIQFQ